MQLEKQIDLRLIAHAKEVLNIPGEEKQNNIKQVMNTTSPYSLYSRV
jgi:6-phosphogluconolactonase/glucosamine-6-phosphate isomerase/deaminase